MNLRLKLLTNNPLFPVLLLIGDRFLTSGEQILLSIWLVIVASGEFPNLGIFKSKTFLLDFESIICWLDLLELLYVDASTSIG